MKTHYTIFLSNHLCFFTAKNKRSLVKQIKDIEKDGGVIAEVKVETWCNRNEINKIIGGR